MKKSLALSIVFIIPSLIISFIIITILILGILALTYNYSLHYQPVDIDLYRQYQYGGFYLLTGLIETIFIAKFVINH